MTRTTVPSSTEPHLAIVGGGLSGLLTAWRALDVNPDLRVTVYEARDEVAGDHTWSFNDSDVPEGLRDWIAPFVRHSWPRYDVRFPRRERTLEIGYRSGDSDSLRAAIAPLRDSGRLTVLTGHAADPSDIEADAVVDARGFEPREDTHLGYQKFVGHTIRTKRPHGLDHPVIMDATVEQVDGYRFVYLLPFSDTELLVEDTYFSDSPHLSENEVGDRIADYISRKGWGDHSIIRREKGVLPMTTATTRDDDTAEIGLRGGFVVSATGFTFPHAVEAAECIAQAIKRGGIGSVPAAIAALRRKHIRRERYPRLLNRMFFSAAEPHRRYIILQRFYGLREGLIRRFYGNRLNLADKARILTGKPPVPVTKALYNLSEKSFIRRATRTAPSKDSP